MNQNADDIEDRKMTGCNHPFSPDWYQRNPALFVAEARVRIRQPEHRIPPVLQSSSPESPSATDAIGQCNIPGSTTQFEEDDNPHRKLMTARLRPGIMIPDRFFG
jgi:hypothetical protein